MSGEYTEIRIRGRTVNAPSARIAGRTIVVTGKWIKLGRAKDEELVEGDIIPDPRSFIPKLRESGLRIDILTFPQRIYEPEPNYNYPIEWQNAAVADTRNFNDWWEKLPQEARKNVRRAVKRGVSTRVVEFDDELVKGIKSIYDESPIRQGRRFWHFGKALETVKMENETYVTRSTFIGAYCSGELIGFMKLVYVDQVAKIMQILSKSAHYDKRPMNALVAKAVQVCHEKGISYLVYSQFTFGNKKGSSLAEFKRRNGFNEMRFPRYYIPITLKGKIALRLKLHLSMLEILPPWLIQLLLTARSTLIRIRSGLFGRQQSIEAAAMYKLEP